MDEQRFDALARAVSAGTSRRRVLGVLAGSLGAMLGGHPVTRAQGNSRNAQRCQKGGWQTLASSETPTVPFASESACVSYGAQVGPPVPLVVNPCAGQDDGTLCSAGVCCGEQCHGGACCPDNNAGCSGTTPACTDGTCVCQGNSCGSGQICVDGTCSPCGDRDEPCCNGECSFDYVLCRSGMCVDCGSPGDPCCDVPDSYCGTATCVDGMCEA
jgi:hypothetical protein